MSDNYSYSKFGQIEKFTKATRFQQYGITYYVRDNFSCFYYAHHLIQIFGNDITVKRSNNELQNGWKIISNAESSLNLKDLDIIKKQQKEHVNNYFNVVVSNGINQKKVSIGLLCLWNNVN